MPIHDFQWLAVDRGGCIDTNWCLHYQEATFLWHRAYLLYVEGLLGCPIPYWNGFAADTSHPSSLYAGLPQAFLDDEYADSNGNQRENPLKYALAMGGKSKGSGRYVTRDPILTTGRSDPGWDAKIAQVALYQKQILLALRQRTFSEPQNVTQAEGRPFGAPWANITVFDGNNPDCWYPYRGDFDGLFEQPHDNFHGWVGGDMVPRPSHSPHLEFMLSTGGRVGRQLLHRIRSDLPQLPRKHGSHCREIPQSRP